MKLADLVLLEITKLEEEIARLRAAHKALTGEAVPTAEAPRTRARSPNRKGTVKSLTEDLFAEPAVKGATFTYDTLLREFETRSIELPAANPREALRTTMLKLLKREDSPIEKVGHGIYRVKDSEPWPKNGDWEV